MNDQKTYRRLRVAIIVFPTLLQFCEKLFNLQLKVVSCDIWSVHKINLVAFYFIFFTELKHIFQNSNVALFYFLYLRSYECSEDINLGHMSTNNDDNIQSEPHLT